MTLRDKRKETAQKGVVKTKEAVNTGQEKLEERKLEKQISDLKQELGGLVYGQKTGAPADNADTEIARIVGEITANEAELAKYAPDTPDIPDAATG